MSLQWVLLLTLGSILVVYLVFVGLLLISGRRGTARAVVGFVPDCVVLFRRLIGDTRVRRRDKVLLLALVPYLAMPFDLVPDFIPVAGQLDDAIIVAFVLRRVVRGSGRSIIEEHWPGPKGSLGVILRLAGLQRAE